MRDAVDEGELRGEVDAERRKGTEGGRTSSGVRVPDYTDGQPIILTNRAMSMRNLISASECDSQGNPLSGII
jgi:hypothetical protein